MTLTWTVEGGTKSGTKISTSGLLTVDATETPESTLTVKATYQSGEETPLVGTATVKVTASV